MHPGLLVALRWKSSTPTRPNTSPRSGPEHSDFWSFHSPAWWKRHWGKSGAVDIEVADLIPDGWRHWLRWDEAALELGFVPKPFESLSRPGSMRSVWTPAATSALRASGSPKDVTSFEQSSRIGGTACGHSARKSAAVLAAEGVPLREASRAVGGSRRPR